MQGSEDNMIAMVGPCIIHHIASGWKNCFVQLGLFSLEIIPEALSGCIVIIYDALVWNIGWNMDGMVKRELKETQLPLR